MEMYALAMERHVSGRYESSVRSARFWTPEDIDGRDDSYGEPSTRIEHSAYVIECGNDVMAEWQDDPVERAIEREIMEEVLGWL